MSRIDSNQALSSAKVWNGCEEEEGEYEKLSASHLSEMSEGKRIAAFSMVGSIDVGFRATLRVG